MKLTVLFLFFTSVVQAQTGKGLIKDIELRTLYDFDEETYNNAIRIKIGNTNYRHGQNLFEHYLSRSQAELIYYRAQANLEQSLENEKKDSLKKWRGLLRNLEVSHRRKNPRDIGKLVKAEKYLSLAGVGEDSQLNSRSKVEIPKQITSGSFVQQTEQEVALDSEIKLASKVVSTEGQALRFLEFGSRGSYDGEEDHRFSARLAFTLPFGFTGDNINIKRKKALTEYKARINNHKNKLELSRIKREVQSESKLFDKLKKMQVSKRDVKRALRSEAMKSSDKLSFLLDVIELDQKILELKYKLASLHNKRLKILNENNSDEYIGLSSDATVD